MQLCGWQHAATALPCINASWLQEVLHLVLPSNLFDFGFSASLAVFCGVGHFCSVFSPFNTCMNTAVHARCRMQSAQIAALTYVLSSLKTEGEKINIERQQHMACGLRSSM